MKTYTYYFNDGTKSTVEVTDELYAILEAFDDEERNNNRANTRRHNSLTELEQSGIDIVDPSGDAFDELMRVAERNTLDKALDSLTESQRKLFEAVYYENKKVIDIAAEQNVGQPAISNRLERIKKKIARILSLDRDNLPFSWLYSEGVKDFLQKKHSEEV